MKYKTFLYGREIPELIIEDGETWIRVDDKHETFWSGLWPGIAYERLEVVRAKGYDPTRGSFGDPSGGRGRPSGRYSDGHIGSYHYLVDESIIYNSWDSPPISDMVWEAAIVDQATERAAQEPIIKPWNI